MFVALGIYSQLKIFRAVEKAKLKEVLPESSK